MMDRTRSRFDFREGRIFWAVVLFAFFVRLGAAGYWQHQVDRSGESFRFGDSHSYWIIATNLARGEGYQFGSENSKIFRAPLYPMFLAAWTWIGPDNPSFWGVWGARCMGCVFGACGVACIMIMARMVSSATVAILAGIFAAIYPGAIAMSIFVLSEAVATPLYVASCTLLMWGLRKSRLSSWAFTLAGITLALACLARPSWSLWPAIAIPYVWFAIKPKEQTDWLSMLRCIFLFCVGAVVTMVPWWIRNYQVTGKFVPTTLQVGASLYDGWHAGASGSSDENMDFVIPFIEAQNAEDEMLAKQGLPLESTLEWRIDRRMRRAAWEWAWKNPSDAIQLSLVKLQKTWAPIPVAQEVQPLIRWAEGIGYGGLVVGAIAGAWWMRRERGAWLTWMPCLYLALLHAIFIGSVRYRQPGVLLLCPLAAVGWMVVFEWIRRRGSRASDQQIDSE
jgi:4-amino-4-deoxy-L-arabinose transferase-like glycosyltransferase